MIFELFREDMDYFSLNDTQVKYLPYLMFAEYVQVVMSLYFRNRKACIMLRDNKYEIKLNHKA